MEVRRASASDVEEMATQMKAVVDEGVWLATESDTTVEQLVERFGSALEGGETLLVLEDEGRIVGGLGLHPTRARGVLTFGMSILSSHRGRGGGRLLLEAAVEAAREAGARKLELEVFPENEAAIGLYRALGFEDEGLKRDHYERRDGSLRSVLLMARFI